MTSILFLDIDGVLNFDNCSQHAIENPAEYAWWTRGNCVNISKVDILRNFCAIHNVKVVIVSSWVNDYTKLLSVTNFLQLPIIDKTDYTGGGLCRGRSVLLFNHINQINKYVILDDSWQQMYDLNNPLLNNHIIRIDGRVGVTQQNLIDAEKIIKGQ